MASVANGSFESGAFWPDWNYTGDASITPSFAGESPTDGVELAVITTDGLGGWGAVTDADLETFLSLPAGELDSWATPDWWGDADATEGSAIEQTLFGVSAGDELTFDWNLVTNEGAGAQANFSDYGFLVIQEVNTGNPDFQVLGELATVGLVNTGNPSYPWQSGYNTYTYAFPADGDYSIAVGVVDVNDRADGQGKSSLLVDNFSSSSNLIVGTAFADSLEGTGNDDTIQGLGGNDTLKGLAGEDLLKGDAGNDQLNGGSGQDQLEGGTGNDIYYVDNAFDVVTENVTGGTDLVQSSITYTLPNNVEKLTLTGNRAINGTGNTLSNTLTGNSAVNTLKGGDDDDILIGQAGNDKLYGGTGADNLNGGSGNDTLSGDAENDTLTGSTGADRFLYNTNVAFRSSAVGQDSITDFSSVQGDKIVLDKTTFTKISSWSGVGFSSRSEFASVTSSGAAATSAADIVYNRLNGALFYNQNGGLAGFGTGGQFLTLTNKPSLNSNSFLIQA